MVPGAKFRAEAEWNIQYAANYRHTDESYVSCPTQTKGRSFGFDAKMGNHLSGERQCLDLRKGAYLTTFTSLFLSHPTCNLPRNVSSVRNVSLHIILHLHPGM